MFLGYALIKPLNVYFLPSNLCLIIILAVIFSEFSSFK